ncbi:PAS domain S-box protein [Anaerolineales bacterium HSG6]|nr:PAS domain S-box protein [Anaerolineales bacterium HSG6]
MSKLFTEWLETKHQQIIDNYIVFRHEMGDQRPAEEIEKSLVPAILLIRQGIAGDAEFETNFKKLLYRIIGRGLPIRIMEDASFLIYKSIQQILLAEEPSQALLWSAELGEIMLIISQLVTEVVTTTLEQNQSRERTLLDLLPVQVFWKDSNLVYLGGNKQFAQRTGFSSGAELVGKRDDDMVWSDRAEAYQADDRAVMEAGESRINLITCSVLPNGTTLWVRSSKIPLRNERQEIFGLLGIYEDITAQKEAEQALQLAQASLDATADNLYWINEKAEILQVNQAACQKLGYTPKEVEQLTVFDVDPLFPPEAWPNHWQNLRENKHLMIETAHQTKAGDTYPVEVRLTYFEFDGMAYNFAVAHDITERREATVKLEENNAMYKALLEFASTGLVMVESSGKIDMVNQQLTEMFGYTADELQGQSINILLPERFRSGHGQFISSYFTNPTPRLMGKGRELVACRKDGSEFPVEISLSFAKTSTKAVALASMVDLTHRKQVEAEQKRLQQEVIAAQQRVIQELSVPIIPVMDGIIVMPLIGSIDSMRARDLMRTMLQGISDHRAKIVIMDITGVLIVDTGVASHLDKTIQAARLKGARTIVTGISDAVAETVIELGIDWSNLETVRDLQTGLMVALDSLGMTLNR